MRIVLYVVSASFLISIPLALLVGKVCSFGAAPTPWPASGHPAREVDPAPGETLAANPLHA